MRGPHEKDDETAAKTCRSTIRRLMLARPRWWTPSELQREIAMTIGVLYSDGSITRRLRELRETRHGGYEVEVQRRDEMVTDGTGRRRRSREREYLLKRRLPLFSPEETR